jgi:hypothetical protein
VSEECWAGCCPHESVSSTPDAGCPDDLAQAPLSERAAHLYICQTLSTRKIAVITRSDRGRITQLLHEAGIIVTPRGSVRQLTGRTTEYAAEAGKLLGVSGRIVLRSAHDQGLPVRVGGAPPSRSPSEIELLAALYGNSQVRRVLDRHGVRVVETPGPVSKRFAVPHRLSESLVVGLYQGCGLSLRQIELVTGSPAAAAGALLSSSGIKLRPAGGRSPFMRRWREERI